MNVIDCEHCYPEKRNHFRMKMFNLLECFVFDPFVTIISKIFLLSELDFIQLNNLLNRLCLVLFQKLKLFIKTDTLDRKQLNNSILALWDEAQKRGLELYNFKESNAHTLYFMLIFHSKKYYFTQTPISLIYQKSTSFDSDIKYDNKWIFKKKLLTNQIPCPRGKMFISSRRAYNYGLSLGFPLAVKPVSGSLSIHALCNIRTPIELKDAIRIVKQVDCRVLVEQHVPGAVYRSLIINNSLVACVMRQPGKIIGDGKSTVRELMDKENKTLGSDSKTHYNYALKSQGVSLNTVLNKDQHIFISNKVTMSSGSTITDVIELIHPENKQLLERVHKILNVPLTGLDFICQNISIPWYKQSFGIIENNSFPYIDLHLNTSGETQINVAGIIWDYVLCVLNRTNRLG